MESESTKFTKIQDDSPTLSQAYADWLDVTDIRESTKDLYRNCWPHLKPLKDQTLASINRKQVKELLEALPFSKGRIKQVRTLLNHCYNVAIENGTVESSPTTGLKLNYVRPSESKELKYWTKSQASSLLSHKPTPRFDLFYRLALHTGCRRGEILGLKWKQVNFDQNTIFIAGTYDTRYGFREPKTEHSKRTIKLRKEEIQVLNEHHYPTLEWVFQRPDKLQPISVNSIQNEFYSLCDSLSLPHIGLHGLRHTHATLALQARTPIEIVSKRLGHSTVSMTYDIYRHIVPAEDESLANTLGELLD